jgi:hypothetical protein
MSEDNNLGFSGALAKRFQDSKITPLLALTGLLLGFFAIAVTPREEEPQINVTFANIFVPFPGAGAVEVENLVAIPLEQVLSEIEGIKHTYSVSRPGMATMTIQFEVGEDRTAAIVRLYNAIYSHQDWMPPDSGVMQPLIKPKGIDDVPTVRHAAHTNCSVLRIHSRLRSSGCQVREMCTQLADLMPSFMFSLMRIASQPTDCHSMRFVMPFRRATSLPMQGPSCPITGACP